MLFPRKLSKNVLIIVLALLSIGIIISGYLYYKHFEKTHRISVEQQLTAIADLKAGEIVQWRKERLGDASVYYRNASFSAMLKRFLDEPRDTNTRNSLVIWLTLIQSAYQYNRVFITDTQGIERISVPETPKSRASSFSQKNTAEILRSGKVTFLDFHREAPNRPIRLAVLVPIYDEQYNRQPLGALVLRIDPKKYLYPLIKHWPTPAKTAETLLIRREGNEAVFLNELKFRKNSALVLRIPLTRTDMPAVRAALDYEGIMEGKDYRGVPVIASIQRVPNSPWFLVARMDISEVYAPVRERLWITIILVTALLAGAGGAVGLFWRQQTTGFYRERLKTAEEIKESEERYRLLADHMSDTVWLLDLNLKTTYCSPSVEKLRGYTASEIIALPLEKQFTPESYKILSEVLREEMAKTEKDPSYSFVRTLELGIVCKDGSTSWSEKKISLIRDEDGRPVSILGEGRDITERKRAESASALNSQRMQTLLQLSQMSEATLQEITDFALEEAVRLTQSKIGYLAFLNEDESVLTMHSWSKSAMAECAIIEKPIVYPVESTGLWGEAVRQRRPVITNDYTTANPLKKGCPQGHVVLKRHMNTPVFEGSRIVIVAGVGNKVEEYDKGDVQQLTLLMEGIWRLIERKRARGELNRLYAELEQRVIDRTAQLEAANKELEAFSYSVSHDLRAPLRHMSGFVDLLKKRFEESLPEKGRHYMNNIADSARQMGILIDDLLEFSRTGRQEMRQEDLDMNIILKEALEQLDQDTDKRKIEWIVPPLPPAHGDHSMMKLVWANLLGNAVKFTRGRKKTRIEVGAEEKDDETIYFVKDNGIGFDMKYVHKLFGVFQRLHSTEEFEGTGVGLANVRRIITRHGGRTWAEAKLNEGAIFYFSMPKRKENSDD